MIRWLLSLFAWREVHGRGVWAYYENSLTGKRRAVRRVSGGYSPVDIDWLERRTRPSLGAPPPPSRK